jgi:taurine transport system substrate-binding protein
MEQAQRITRRAALAGATAAVATLAARRARAAAATVNVGFFTETKPTMIAKGEGWFEEGMGTKIAWTEYGSGAEINTAIVANGCDIGLATGSVATAAAMAQGLPLQLVGMVDNIGAAEEMTVRASENIHAPADFKGKTLATPFGSTSHFRLLGFLKVNGLTQADVTVLDMKPAAIVAAWSRKEIDAAYVWAPAKSKLLADGGVPYPTADALDKAGYVIADLIVVRNGFAKDQPDAVVAFLKEYGRALDLWQQKPEEAAAIVAKQAGVSPEVATGDMKEYDFIPLRAQLGAEWLGAPGKPGRFPGVLKSTADFLKEQRSIRTAPALAAFQNATNTEYLERALAS